MTETADGLVDYCRENGRVCPLPPFWNRLWEMLPDRARDGAGWRPALPLILAAWHEAPVSLKASRLEEHIRWAAEHNALEPIGRFLRELHEHDWFHIDD